MNKYEQIVEYLTNGETEKARALFHEIAVTESRKIYESLISDEDFNEEVSDDKTGDMIDDISNEVEDEETSESQKHLGKVITSEEAKQLLDYLDGSLVEGADDLLEKVANFYGVKMESVKGALEENSDAVLDVAYGSVNEEGDDEEGADAADDGVVDAGDEGGEDMGDEMGDEMPVDDMGGDEAGEEEIEDRVMDLENALDELKAEFDELMADEMSEPEHADLAGDEMGDEMGGDEMDMGDEVADDEMAMGDEMGMDDEMEGMMSMARPTESKDKTQGRSASDLMREYIEKVGTPENSEGKGVGDGGKEAVVNTKSTVAGKNDMGGSAKNLVNGGSEAAPDGTSAPSSDKPGKLPHAGSFQNVAGGKVKQSSAKSPVTSEPSGVNKRSPHSKA